MKKYKILLVCLFLIIFVSGCGKEEVPVETVGSISSNRNVFISGNIGTGKFIGVNIAMDCCYEYYSVMPFVNEIENAKSLQIFNVDMYDENGEKTQPTGPINVLITLPMEVINANGKEYVVYQLKDDNSFEKLECNVEAGTLSFTTDYTGIYAVIKTSDDENEKFQYAITDCDGTCNGCVDETH